MVEAYLREDGRAVVVFDGLDEIFEPQLREMVARQIGGFAARYPKTRVIVGHLARLPDNGTVGYWNCWNASYCGLREAASCR
jgi:hypothetical protein